MSSPAHAAVAESIANRGLSKHRPSSSATSHNADNESVVPARRERRRSSATKTSDNAKSPGVVEPSDNQNGARRPPRRSSGLKSSEPSSASLPTMSAQNSYNSSDSRTEPTDLNHFAPERSGNRMPDHSGAHKSVHNICSDSAGHRPAESFSRDGKLSAALRTPKAVVMLEPLDPEVGVNIIVFIILDASRMQYLCKRFVVQWTKCILFLS